MRVVVLLLLLTSPAGRQEPPPPLVILSDTGTQRDGRPVVERVTRPEHLAVLSRGFSGRLLRLYQLAQRFAHPEQPAEPAYLVLSDNEGGFPRAGFVLDGQVHTETAFVDLHRRSDLSGRAGAMDQIFPHELMHIIVNLLAGEPPHGHATQVHAIGVRTDRITAFDEGFAEHAQVMAIDDADAVPETKALATDLAARDHVRAQFEAFRSAVSARWSIAPKARMTFPLWFSRGEQVLRYHDVKANLFAREADVPARLLTNSSAYDAYLIENVLPGRADSPPKSATRLLSTEGVVSALFYRLVNAPPVRETPRDEPFYARFGLAAAPADPIENAYLKVFAAIHEGGHDAAAVVDAYGELFPDERAGVDAVLRDVLIGQEPSRAGEIWLLNERFTTGTTLFDQYRGLPRSHAFDLNASSRGDLAGVPGVNRELAAAILAGAPYASVDDLQRVPGMRPTVLASFHEMERAMRVQPASGTGTATEDTFSFRDILIPYARRALTLWLICAALAAALYRAVRRVSWWRLALNGLGAAFVGLVAGWTIDAGTGMLALVVPTLLWGVPGALIGFWRSRSPREAGRILAAWALASLVAFAAVRPTW
jgi:hypothetical protein